MIVSGLRRFLKCHDESNEHTASQYASVYRESVLYALEDKAVQMSKIEMTALLDRHVYDVDYLVKSQRCFHERLSQLYVKSGWTADRLLPNQMQPCEQSGHLCEGEYGRNIPDERIRIITDFQVIQSYTAKNVSSVF